MHINRFTVLQITESGTNSDFIEVTVQAWTDNDIASNICTDREAADKQPVGAKKWNR